MTRIIAIVVVIAAAVVAWMYTRAGDVEVGEQPTSAEPAGEGEDTVPQDAPGEQGEGAENLGDEAPLPAQEDGAAAAEEQVDADGEPAPEPAPAEGEPSAGEATTGEEPAAEEAPEEAPAEDGAEAGTATEAPDATAEPAGGTTETASGEAQETPEELDTSSGVSEGEAAAAGAPASDLDALLDPASLDVNAVITELQASDLSVAQTTQLSQALRLAASSPTQLEPVLERIRTALEGQ
jgi:hypothetical protein